MPRLIGISEGKVANIACNVNEESSRADLDQALIAEWEAAYGAVALIGNPTFRAEIGDDWDGAKGVEALAILRARAMAVVNLHIESTIRAGFEFPYGSGQRFSMSNIAQLNLEVENNARDLPETTYPVLFSFMDDSGSYACPNATVLHDMWLAALALRRNALDAGRTIKSALAFATTAEDIDAVMDAL